MAQQVCGKRDEILKTLAAPKYQETPVGHGLTGIAPSLNYADDGMDGQTTIYSKHFRKTCIIAAGGWEFVGLLWRLNCMDPLADIRTLVTGVFASLAGAWFLMKYQIGNCGIAIPGRSKP
jgi:hypothetical protein